MPLRPSQAVGGLATRYDKYAIVYRAAVVLNAELSWSKLLSDTPQAHRHDERVSRFAPPTRRKAALVAPVRHGPRRDIPLALSITALSPS